METLMDADVLWLGLHKTGTTFLQKSLDLSQAALEQAGIAYVGLEEFRRRWTRPLLHKDHPEAPAPGVLPAGRARWLVFDENILALVQHALTCQGLYPRGGGRARIVADHLQLRRPRIVLGLRGFAGLVPSLYCEALKSTPFKTFDQFLMQPVEEMSWLPLIEGLHASFPDSEMLLYRAEDLPGREARLLAEVTGLPETAFTLLDKPERLGFSHAAVTRLQHMAEGGPVSREDVRAVVRNLPREPGQPGFSPWTPEDRAILEANYARDMAILRKRAGEGRLQILDLAGAG